MGHPHCQEYRTVLHVHTKCSDGSGSMSDIIGAAETAKVDFVLVADHNTLRARREGWEGWH